MYVNSKSSKNVVDQKRPEIIFHLAAQSLVYDSFVEQKKLI